MTTPVTGPTIYAGWLVTGNSEGGVTRGYGLEEDFWEEPPTRFVHRLDGRIFGMPSRVPNQSFEVAGYYSPEPGYNVVVYRTMPWFGAIDVPLTVFGKAAGVTKKAIWQRVYARPVAALTPAPRGGLE